RRLPRLLAMPSPVHAVPEIRFCRKPHSDDVLREPRTSNHRGPAQSPDLRTLGGWKKLMAELDIESFLREAFEANFERLREESGRSVTPDVKAAALEQVLLYWKRLRELAEKVTETEIRLLHPDQRTPAGRRYTLEGIVDIVREADTTTLYDVKT